MSKTKTQNAKQAPAKAGYQGTEKLLWGIVLAVITFWLFAGTVGTVAPAIQKDIGEEVLGSSALSLAVSITGLFSGLFIVLAGGIADKLGRVKITLIGVVLNIVGSLLLVVAGGAFALPMLLTGRIIQGFAAACIMPASMALVKTYWDGAKRQRAVSMWSIGSWGGSGLAALFGGAVIKFTPLGWRGIFIVGIAISVVSFLMILGTPESRVAKTDEKKAFDILGFISFIVGTLGLMLVLLYGSNWGWLSPQTLLLAAFGVVGYIVFVLWELKQANPFVDFKLFRNTTFTGATISNFLFNGTIGMLIVSQTLIQVAGHKPDGSLYNAWDAGILTLGYGLCIIVFIRSGEKLLQKFGPRKPMLWAAVIVIIACVLLMMTHVLVGQYTILAVVAYALFGLGLAFYATPSTDAALSNLPAAQAGAGAGIYKMASSLGGAIGTAISLAVFYGLQGAQVPPVIAMAGRTDNSNVRLAAMVALGVSLVFLLLAIISIVSSVPKGGGSRDLGQSADDAAPRKHLPPDEAKAKVLERLSHYSLHDLEELEKQHLVNELAKISTPVLKKFVDSHKH